VTDPTTAPQTTDPSRPASVNPPYFDALAELFEHYTATWDEADHRFTDWVTGSIPGSGGESALDLGCGAGRHTTLLAEHYPRVLAVDIADRMLHLARSMRATPGVDYQRRSVLEVTGERDGQFDLVLSVHTLHHVGDPAVVLPHIRSLVAPGGTAILADIVDPGGWSTPQFHTDRAFADARRIYQLGGDADDAAWMLRLLLHPHWLAMTSAATPLTREQFHHHYRTVFPGAVFADDLNPIMCGAVWHVPARPDQTPREWA
jgi:2-polyprenyl-3-methyl-5-hydroxy-6-metoxy-1,4-benzoquinol methylase